MSMCVVSGMSEAQSQNVSCAQVRKPDRILNRLAATEPTRVPEIDVGFADGGV
jgi:hypothetical protein